MEKSLIEAIGFGGMTGYYNPNSKTHNITKQEHKWFIEWQESNRRKEEKEKRKNKSEPSIESLTVYGK